jgi:hypothetical protein
MKEAHRAHVIYNKETTRLYHTKKDKYTFKSEAAAKAALTRAIKNDEITEEHLIAPADTFYAEIEQQVERTNIMTGETFMESINTPSYCSPSSEAYWSM